MRPQGGDNDDDKDNDNDDDNDNDNCDDNENDNDGDNDGGAASTWGEHVQHGLGVDDWCRENDNFEVKSKASKNV